MVRRGFFKWWLTTQDDVLNKNYYFLGLLAPYLDLPCILSLTPAVSNVPLIIWYLTPGRSFTLPPLIKTTLCSCKLCPIPGMYEVTSYPFESLTLATFLNAEFGFFGVTVFTTVHTPLFCGALLFVNF